VQLYYQAPGSSTWHYTTMSRESGSTYKATLGPFDDAGTARYYIKAKDNAGNSGTSSIHALTISNCKIRVPLITTRSRCQVFEPNDNRRVNPWLICSLVLLAYAAGYISSAYQQPAVALEGPLVGPQWQYMSDGTNHILRIDLSVADPIPERFTYCPQGSTDIYACWQESTVYNKK